jgi:hypothetical protein
MTNWFIRICPDDVDFHTGHATHEAAPHDIDPRATRNWPKGPRVRNKGRRRSLADPVAGQRPDHERDSGDEQPSEDHDRRAAGQGLRPRHTEDHAEECRYPRENKPFSIIRPHTYSSDILQRFTIVRRSLPITVRVIARDIA